MCSRSRRSQGWRLDKARIADSKLPRVLLIGDSILNGYRNRAIRALEGKAYVDAWVNPYHQSEHLNKLLARVLEHGPYDVVHFNMGLHGWPEGRIKPGTFEPLTKAYVEVIRKRLLKAFDLDYGWGFQWDNAAKFRAQWEKMRDERPRGGARFIRFIDNHDIANDNYDNRIEKAWGSRRVQAALVTLFTLDGVPMIYNGQEAADTARHSIFGRSPIAWDNGDTPAGKSRYAFCKKLCTIRRAERALTHGEVVWLDNDQPDTVLSFHRRTSDDVILSAVNLSDRAIKVRITLPERTQWSDNTLFADGADLQSADGSPVVNLDRFGYLVANLK